MSFHVSRLFAMPAVCSALTATLVACASHPSTPSAPAAPTAAMAAVPFGTRGDVVEARSDAYMVRAQVGSLAITASPGDPTGAAAVTLSTRSVKRGTADLRDARATIAVDADGSTRTDHGTHVERLEGRADGVEQSWRFERAPAGVGDLEVRLGIDGAQYTHADAQGIHFSQHLHGRGLRYGHATWIDARGATTPIDTRWDHNELVLTVADDIIARTVFPATLDPVIGPEFAIDDTLLPGLTINSVIGTGVASDGTNYLATWFDARASRYQLFAARVAPDGSILDPRSVLISHGGNSVDAPSAAFDGVNYVVAWTEMRGTSTLETDVRVARVTPAGVVLDVDGVRVSDGVARARIGGIACRTSECFITFAQGGGIYGARFDSTGTLLDPNGVQYFASAQADASPRVAFDGAHYLLSWTRTMPTTSGDVYAARIDIDGTPIDAVPISVNAGTGVQTVYGLAFNGTNYLVVWREVVSSSGRAYASRIGTNGAVLDSTAIPIGVGVSDVSQPRICSDGTNFLVSFVRGSSGDPFYQRVRTDGTLVDAAPVSIAPGISATNADVASTGSGFLVAFDSVLQPYEVTATRIGAGGEVLDPSRFVISQAIAAEDAPSAAFDGTNYAVAFQVLQNGGANRDIYVSRLSATGAALDAAPIAVAVSAGDEELGGIDFDGTNFLVVWTQTTGSARSVRAARVSRTGVVLDTTPIVVPGSPSGYAIPTLAFRGTSHLLAWTELRAPNGLDIVGVRVSTSGAVLDASPMSLVSRAGDQTAPVLRANSSTFFLTYLENTDRDIRCGFSTTGTSFGAFAVFLTTTSQTGTLSTPDAAWDGNNWLVTWRDARSTSTVLRGGRINSSGTALDPNGFDIATETASVSSLRVAHDGGSYTAVWSYYPLPAPSQIRAARVSPTGTADAAVTVAADTYSDLVPTIVHGAGTSMLVAYRRFDESANVLSNRIYGRIVDFSGSPLGAACTSASQCQSGNCVDGVCCNTSCGGTNPDCMACSVAAGAATDGICATARSGSVCRPAAAACDVAEICDGTSTVCPSNRVAAAGTVCREAVSVCDVAERCNGTSSLCPNDSVVTGSTTLCRAATHPCELNVYCIGNNTCPTITRPVAAGTVCRPAAGGCDIAEQCDGTAIDCPPDVLAPVGATCRAAAGVCDIAETCSGIDAACPMDQFATNVICRSAAGPCDIAERCAGSEAACPPDELADTTTLCRPAVGLCDVAEHCNGANAWCPADEVLPAGSVCRAATSVCDSSESCDGFVGACPTDRFAPDGTTCGDGLACNGDETCSGGACGAGRNPCDDGDPCTTDLCAEPASCTHVAMTNCSRDGGADVADVADAVSADAEHLDGSGLDVVDRDVTDAPIGDSAITADAHEDASADGSEPPATERGCACRAAGPRSTSGGSYRWFIVAITVLGSVRRRRRERDRA